VPRLVTVALKSVSLYPMKLINNTKGTSKIGHAVIVDPRNPQSFIYAPADSTNVLGVISESKPYRELCEIATSGVAQVYVSGNTQKGSIIRSRKSNETVSAGACKVVSSSDTSYMKIGTALEAGRGLVKCQILIQYFGGAGVGADDDNIDGGSAASVYLPDQSIDGGSA